MILSGAFAAPTQSEAGAIIDSDLIEDIHAERGQALFGFARRLGLSDEQAADAVQETMYRLWRESVRGHGVPDPVAWSFRTIYRISMDEHRMRRRMAALRERISRRPGPNTAAASGDDDHFAVWEAVDRLPSRQRHALYLRYRADLQFDDVGRVLGISAGGARTLVSRGLDRLRHELADEGQG